MNYGKGVLELRDEIKKAEEEISFAEKCGPIYDVLGDISHDANLLKKVEATDNESTQPLEYILMRLNRIEDAIVYSRNQELSRQNEERFPLLRAMHFKYDLIDRKYSMKALKSMLSQVDRTDPNVHVRDIFVDTEKRVVSIYMHLSDFIDVPAAYDYFIKTLSGFGFYGAAPVVREG